MHELDAKFYFKFYLTLFVRDVRIDLLSKILLMGRWLYCKEQQR